MSWRGFILYCVTNGVVIALLIVLGFTTHYRLVKKAEDAARDAIAAAELKILELEKANEALPDNRCGGLGRDRVELLHRGPR